MLKFKPNEKQMQGVLLKMCREHAMPIKRQKSQFALKNSNRKEEKKKKQMHKIDKRDPKILQLL